MIKTSALLQQQHYTPCRYCYDMDLFVQFRLVNRVNWSAKKRQKTPSHSPGNHRRKLVADRSTATLWNNERAVHLRYGQGYRQCTLLRTVCSWFHIRWLLFVCNHSMLALSFYRVSTAPGNPGNILEFVWSSWKFLCKMSMIDCIGFQSWWYWVPDRLFKKLVAHFIFAMAPMLCVSCFCSIFRQTSRFGTLHSRPKECKHVLDFSWNPSWNLLEISWKFVQLHL